jgi:hypothetical protein
MQQRRRQEEQQRPCWPAGGGKNGYSDDRHLQCVGMQVAERAVFQMEGGGGGRTVAAGMRMVGVCVGVDVGAA